MKGKRSTRVITLGVAVFVAGTALTFVGLRKGDAKATPVSKPAVASVSLSKPANGAAAMAQAPSPVTVLPDGMEAVAVQLPYVPGLAGYVRANDLINVYAVIKNGQPIGTTLKQPLVRLVLTDVRVLDVSAPQPGTGDGNATFLLSLNTKQAEQVIFLARNESMWFTLVKPNARPSVPHGRGYENLL